MINWGIIGLGKIAKKFAEDIELSNNSRLYGVASRDIKKAKKFSQDYNSSTYFGSYEELASNSNIDVIYISTPHVLHYENTMMCLKNGKAVLCEKPMGMNATEVKSMVKEATSRKLFLMEGLWTRFIPAIEKLIKVLNEQVIGEIVFLRSDFGFKPKFDLKSRLFNKELGAGSLLDIGIYPIYLSLITLGKPNSMKVMSRMTTTNVDSFCSMLFDYKNGSKAVLESTIEAETPMESYIYGKDGSIILHRNFHHPKKITVHKGLNQITYDKPYKGNGYTFEIEEVNNCIINSKIQSTKLPLNLSLDLIRILDKVREEMDLTYISDKILQS